MDPEPGPLASRPAAHAATRYSPRRHPRQSVHSLVYVTLDQGNGGIIHDLNEDGLSVHAVAALRPHQSVRLRFSLTNPKTRVDAVGLVAWSAASGQAGVQFTGLPQRSREQLKEWLLTNLLVDASRNSALFRELPGLSEADETSQLLFSSNGRTPIQLPPQDSTSHLDEARRSSEVKMPWWPAPISAERFSRFVDGLVILASILLFCVVFLSVSEEMLSWPMVLAIVLGCTAIFSVLYWLLFIAQGLSTPGRMLAKLAGEPSSDLISEEELARFR
jgi:PilZ domain-containing protein